MRPLSALVFLLGASFNVEAGLVGLRDAFFGMGPYAIVPLSRRAGGIENPERCVGIRQDKRFQPHQPNECRILEVPGAVDIKHGAWNYCPADPNANCQIPMACVDEDLCKGELCGVFGNKDYTTISCSQSFHCGHTAIVDPAQRGLDATRWVCNKTPGFAMTINGKMKVSGNARIFDGKGAQVVLATTFDPAKTSNSGSSSSTSTGTDSSTITIAPSLSISTVTVLATPTSDSANPSPQKPNIAPIIGGGVGGVGALALLCLAIFLYRRHKRTSVSMFTSLPFGTSSSSSSEKYPNSNGNGQATPGSQSMPIPATVQGTWPPSTANANVNGVDATYSSTVSEMPTPDMLGREWNVTPQQQQGPVETSTPSPTAAVWGAGAQARVRQDSLPLPRAQNWCGPVDPHKLDGHGHEAIAPGGLPLSLTAGGGSEQRAELA